MVLAGRAVVLPEGLVPARPGGEHRFGTALQSDPGHRPSAIRSVSGVAAGPRREAEEVMVRRVTAGRRSPVADGDAWRGLSWQLALSAPGS